MKNLKEIKITNLESIEIRQLFSQKKLKILTIFDKKKLPVLYAIYTELWYGTLGIGGMGLRRVHLKLLRSRELPEVRERIERLALLAREQTAMHQLLEPLRSVGLLEPQKSPELEELLNKKSDDEILKELKLVNDFLMQMKELEKKLPNCKIYY